MGHRPTARWNPRNLPRLIAALLGLSLLANTAAAQRAWVQKSPASSPDARLAPAQGYLTGQQQLILFGGTQDGTNRFSDTWRWDGTDWSLVPTAPIPPARSHAAMSSGSKMFLFGGKADGAATRALGDLWEWSGTSWAQKIPSSSPSPRSETAIAYDSDRDVLVLFGGLENNSISIELGDTWEFDGTTWTELTPASSPPRRWGHSMAYDATRRAVVLFGGNPDGFAKDDTWTWDGTTWTEGAHGPGAREDHAMAYDASRQKVVLFGGFGGLNRSSVLLAGTWEWDGTRWEPVDTFGTISPQGRSLAGLAHDATRSALVLFGGTTDGGTAGVNGETWELPGSSNAAPSAQPGSPRFVSVGSQVPLSAAVLPFNAAFSSFSWTFLGAGGPSATFSDPGIQQPFLNTTEAAAYRVQVAATNGTLTTTGQTTIFVTSREPQRRQWKPSTGASPGALLGASAGFHPVRREVVLFGGTENEVDRSDRTWAFEGGVWRDLALSASPPPRSHAAMARSGRLFMFGGKKHTSTLAAESDLWEWLGDSWVEHHSSAGPGSRSESAVAFDANRGKLVLFGGLQGGSISIEMGDTWEYDGAAWTQITTTPAPRPRWGHAMTYDPIRHVTVLFGGNPDGTPLGDTWTWNGVNWVEHTGGPAGREGHSLVFDEARERVVMTGGVSGSQRRLSEAWEWDGGVWRAIDNAGGPLPAGREQHASAYDEGSGSTLIFGGTTSGAASERTSDTWLLASATFDPVLISAGEGQIASVGVSVALSATGLHPDEAHLRYSWQRDPDDPGTGAPIFLSNSSTARPSFTQQTAGSFRLSVTASDGRGSSGTAAVDVFLVDRDAELRQWAAAPELTGPEARTAAAMAFHPASGKTLLFGGQTDRLAAGLADTWELGSEGWLQAFPQVIPPGRAHHAFSSGGRLFMFGGRGSGASSVALGDLWEWDGFAWREYTTVNGPGVRSETALAYDSARDRLVLFGGLQGGSVSIEMGDTWEFDGVEWTQITTSPSPRSRWGHAMAYDAARQEVVLFGGNPDGLFLGDTWTFDGTRWTERPGGPAPRELHAMTFDPLRQRVVMHGGSSRTGRQLGGTWEWDGDRWLSVDPAGPELPEGLQEHALAFDSARGATILFGGTKSATETGRTSETWILPAVSFQPVVAGAGEARLVPPGAQVVLDGSSPHPDQNYLEYLWRRDPFDPGAGPAVFLSGANGPGASFTPPERGSYRFELTASDPAGGSASDTVTIVAVDGPSPSRSWSALSPATGPAARAGHAMAFHPVERRVILFGGQLPGGGPLSDETWELDGAAWRLLTPAVSPPPRSRHAMTQDLAVFLFGGLSSSASSAARDDFWEWNGHSWVEYTTIDGPGARSRTALAVDAARERVVLFGGLQGSTSTIELGDTWEFDGNVWTQRPATPAPRGRWGHAMAFDEARGETVLFGGNPDGALLADTWLLNASGWRQAGPASSPPAREDHQMIYDRARGRVLLFGGKAQGGSPLSDLWSWDGSGWTSAPLQVSPPARSLMGLAYDARTGSVAMFGGTTSTSSALTTASALADTWSLALDEPLPPEPPFVSAVSPATISAGAPASVIVLGGNFFGAIEARLDDPAATRLQSVVVESPSRFRAAVPAGVAAGSHSVLVTSQAGTSLAGGATLQVVEPLARPDVAVTAVSAPPSATQGTELAIAATLSNSSSADAPAFNVSFGLAPSSGGTTSFFASGSVDALGAQASLAVSASAPVPAALAPGLYVPVASADPDRFLDDLDRTNNVLRGAGTVQVAPGQVSASAAPSARIVLLARNGGGPQVVGLDGSSSSDSSGKALSYAWTLVERPDGATAFASLQAVTSYRALLAGTYVFRLTVRQTGLGGLSGSALASLQIAQAQPRANAGPDRIVILPAPGIPSRFTTSTIFIDGSGSRDPTGASIDYRWTLLESPTRSLSASGTGLFALSSPESRLELGDATGSDGQRLDAGIYRIALEVSGTTGLADTDEAVVRVIDPARLLPQAEAGPDRRVRVTVLTRTPLTLAATLRDPTAPGGLTDRIVLDGRASRDASEPPRPLTYAWQVRRVPPGSGVTTSLLAGAATATPSFVPDLPGLYELALEVSNGSFTSAADPVLVLVDVARDEEARGGANRAPFAIARVSSDDGSRLDGAGSARPRVAAGADRVFLDGSQSGDLDDGTRLQYLWTQLSGPPVELAPSRTETIVSLVPLDAGDYRFSLTVMDPEGAVSPPALVELAAFEAGIDPPALTIRSSASTTDATGSDVDSGAGSLRVSLPTTVTFSGSFLEGAARPGRRVSFLWEQLSGPPVVLLAEPPVDESSGESSASFAPTTVGVHEFSLTVTRTDDTTTPLSLSRRTVVLVDAPGERVPNARIAATVQAAKDSSPCQIVELDGSQSDAGAGDSGSLGFLWTLVSGPTVELSDPFSAVTTFVAPDFGDGIEREYTFQLLVDDGVSQSAPAEISVVVSGTVALESSLSLLQGLNLVGLPVDPSQGGALDAADLAELTGASFVARLRAPEGVERSRFEVFLPSLGTPPFEVTGNEAYLIFRPDVATPLALQGTRWSVELVSRAVPQGLSFLHYPRGGTEELTSADLTEETSSELLVQTDGGDSGEGRFQVVHPALTGVLPVSSGRGYLIHSRSAREIRLSGEASDCQ